MYNLYWQVNGCEHDDVIKWKHFPRYWPFVREIHQSPVNTPHKGQWHGALMFSLICTWINGWVKKREAGDLRRHRTLYDVTVMKCVALVTQANKYVMQRKFIKSILRLNSHTHNSMIYGETDTLSITLTPYMVLPLFATRFADYAGGIRVSFIQPRLF